MKNISFILFIIIASAALYNEKSARGTTDNKKEKKDILSYVCLGDIELNMLHPAPLPMVKTGEVQGNGLCKTSAFNYFKIFNTKPALAVLNRNKTSGVFAFSINTAKTDTLLTVIKKFNDYGWNMTKTSSLALKQHPDMNMAVIMKNNITLELISVENIFNKPMIFVKLN